MNTEVFFKTLGSSNLTAKPITAQSVNTNNSSIDSFKKEMDKVFDRNQSATNDAGKNSLTDKAASNKAQGKTDSKEYPEKDVDSLDNGQSTDVTREQQVLAAAQLQQPAVQAVNADFSPFDALQQIQNESVTSVLSETIMKNSETNMADEFGNTERMAEGEIKLPVQNNVDLVKSAMLKEQGENQENKMQNFSQALANSSQIQEEKIPEGNSTATDTANLQSSDSDKPDPTLEQMEIPEENVLVKNTNLDLSKVNIKVAEAPIDTNQADMAKQLADKIMYKLSDGRQEFDLELNPRNLGKVNVKMIFQNGSAELILSTSNSKAHQLLSMQADALRGILESNTGMDSTISLKQAETSDGQFDRDNFQEQNNGQQSQQQQQQEKKLSEDISFIDRLRLGLTDDLDEAV